MNIDRITSIKVKTINNTKQIIYTIYNIMVITLFITNIIC